MATILVDQHIETKPTIRGGRPILAGTRLTVADIVVMHLRLGQSLIEIAGKYELSLAAVHSAMAYYYDHRAEIDADIEADFSFAEQFQAQNHSPLQDKLNRLNRV